jgi:hypothetical protein
MTDVVSKIVDHGFYGNMFWREHYFYKKGDKHKGHTHILDHVTVIMKGSVEVKVGDKDPYVVSAPSILEIPREVFHEFTALEDETIYMCIFATNDYSETLTTEFKDMSKEQKMDFIKAINLCNDCEGCTPPEGKK